MVQSGRRTVYDTETAPFAYLSAQLLVSPHLRGRAAALNRVQLAFKVRNLLDTHYAYPGGFEHVQASIPQNGRNYNLKLQVSLFYLIRAASGTLSRRRGALIQRFPMSNSPSWKFCKSCKS